MKKLNELTVKELKSIALNQHEIALSYTKDGKRHTLTKPELIEAITAKIKSNEVTPVTVETVQPAQTNVNNEKSDNKIATVSDVATVIEKLPLNEVVSFTVAKLKTITCINELQEFKRKLFATFTNKQQTRKRTLKSKWALQYNRLTMLFRQYEMKLS